MDKRYFVYTLTNRSKMFYTGITNALRRRMQEHKQKQVPGYTKKYNLDKLVHYEEFSEVNEAIAREKQIKGWSRKKKIALIERQNPDWKDLTYDLPYND